MALDLYKPSFMLRMVEQMPPFRPFLKDTFFSRKQPFPTESVLFDVVKNGMSAAPYVSPRIGNTVLERDGYSTMKYTPPLVAPMRIITGEELNMRLPGENPVNGYHPNRRKAELLQNDLRALNRSITYREEIMAAQALFFGVVDVDGEGVSDRIGFGFENNIVVDVPWSDFEKSDPLKDLVEARILVSRSGFSPNILIADSKTIGYMKRNKILKDLFDNSGFRVGVIQPNVLANGVVEFGFLREAGVFVYAYDGEYEDNLNENPAYPGVAPSAEGFVPAMRPFVPKGKVFIGSTAMEASTLYGVIHHVQTRSTSAARVPHTWFNEKGDTMYVEIKSRPLVCPKHVNSWAILDVLGGE